MVIQIIARLLFYEIGSNDCIIFQQVFLLISAPPLFGIKLLCLADICLVFVLWQHFQMISILHISKAFLVSPRQYFFVCGRFSIVIGFDLLFLVNYEFMVNQLNWNNSSIQFNSSQSRFTSSISSNFSKEKLFKTHFSSSIQ